MKIAITDANVFIDLIHASLHEQLFACSLEIHTTLNVFDELSEHQQQKLSAFVEEKLLTLHSTETDIVLSDAMLNKRLSSSDKSVLRLAEELNAMILTGDGLLRKISGYQMIEVHGTLWLLNRFVENSLITKTVACEQLKQMMTYNRRLPVEDCERLLATWI